LSIKIDSSVHLKTLTDAIWGGKATLFIGSGVSSLCNSPDGTTLLNLLKKDFPSADQGTASLTDLFQDLIDDPACGPEKLYEYLRNIFLPLIPGDFHKSLTDFDWNTIFTTNYDRLLEQAYEDRGLAARLRRIVEYDYDVNLRDKTKVFLFKLMGSADIPLGQEGDMVLSRKQYHENLTYRDRYLQHLRDCLLDSTFIIMGYSGRDRLLFDVIEKTFEKRTIDKIPHSFMIIKEDTLSPKNANILGAKKIIPIHISLQDFMKHIQQNRPASSKIQKPQTCYRTIRVEATKIPMNEVDFNKYSEDFEILTEEAIESLKGDKGLFFKAQNMSWGAFREDWDFKREVYVDFKKRVLAELAKTDPKDNVVLTLTGPPGSGKSTTLRRLAYDIYCGGCPVIILNEYTSKLDYRSIDSFIVYVNHKFDEVIGGERHRAIKPLIIIDDAPSLLFDPSRISQYLRSRSRSALVVIGGRTGEWAESWYTGASSSVPKNTFEEKDLMSPTEIDAFLKYLEKVLDTKLTIEDIQVKCESSFFASMYTAIDETHRPLEEIIKGLYRDLPPEAKKAYEMVCCLHQFGLAMPQLLLARYLDCYTINELFEILSPNTKDAIIEDEDLFGNLFYRSPHRIVARKTVEFFLGDPAIQLGLLEDIISKANFSVRSERGLIERLLVRNIHQSDLSFGQKQNLYKKACEKQEIRSVVHHWGILEMDNGHMDEAKAHLERALSLKEPSGLFKGESDRNILTSLGVLHSHIALSNYKEHPEVAAKNVDLAESYFQKAKTESMRALGEHPYGAHAHMLYEIACLTTDETDKMSYLSSALQIIDDAKKRGIAKKEGTFLDEIELKVWAMLNDEKKIRDAIETIAEKRHSAKGYYLYAKFLMRFGKTRKDLEKAYSILAEGLEQFPDDQECAALRIELFLELYPRDQKQLYYLLSTYVDQTAYPQIALLFEAATLAIQMGYYTMGLKWYQKLEHLSRTEEDRFVIRRYLTDSNGNKRVLKGQIVKIINQYEGEIRCETLPEYPRNIRFRPIGLPLAEKDTVMFSLGFSSVEPVATNIRGI
jgi:hypothetical protein